MVKHIKIYTDETRCNKNTFHIYAVVWGEETNCTTYCDDIAQLVVNNRSIVGRDFKEFHAHNLTATNWDTMGSVYLQVLRKLVEYIRAGRFGLLISIESIHKYIQNAGYLKNQLKQMIQNRQGQVGSLFKTLQPKDFPALYHRVDQLMIFFKYRHLFGDNSDFFVFHPDASGKILTYEDKKFPMSVATMSYPLDFYQIVTATGNGLIKLTSKVPGWSKENQRIGEFCPVDSKNSFLVQSCDIVSNFYFNFLRHQVNIRKDVCKLKADALMRHIELEEHAGEILPFFGRSEDEVVCTDDDLKANIQLHV